MEIQIKYKKYIQEILIKCRLKYNVMVFYLHFTCFVFANDHHCNSNLKTYLFHLAYYN